MHQFHNNCNETITYASKSAHACLCVCASESEHARAHLVAVVRVHVGHTLRAAVLEPSHWGAVTHIAVRPNLYLTSAPSRCCAARDYPVRRDFRGHRAPLLAASIFNATYTFDHTTEPLTVWIKFCRVQTNLIQD